MNDKSESITGAGISINSQKSSAVLIPTWIRLPREGRRCPHTNLTRASLNKLILGDHPKVESIVLKEKGTARGVRLIRLSSLLDYLESIAENSKA